MWWLQLDAWAAQQGTGSNEAAWGRDSRVGLRSRTGWIPTPIYQLWSMLLGHTTWIKKQTKMNLQPRVEKAPTYISKLKVGIKVKGHEQQDVAFIDAPICLRHWGSLHILSHLFCFIILISRHYLLHLTEKKTEWQGGYTTSMHETDGKAGTRERSGGPRSFHDT